MANPTRTILVTGDLVLDHHLYEGTSPDPHNSHERPLSSLVEWGGASLLYRLLQQVELERRIDILWQTRIEARKSNPAASDLKEPSRPKADDPELAKVPTDIATSLAWADLPQPDALGCLPSPVCTSHGYALFSPTPRSAKDTRLVWRVSKALGYGSPTGSVGSAGTPAFPALSSNLPARPHVVCLDDAGSGFRHLRDPESNAWCLPARRTDANESGPWIVLKLSGDLESGPLWDRLARRRDLHSKLVVVVSAQQLRMAEVRLSSGLSWERSVEHLLCEFRHNPALQRLHSARHVIVHFGIDGAVWIDLTKPRKPQALLVFDAANAEGEWAEALEGRAFAYQTCVAAAVCRLLATSATDGTPLAPDAIARALGAGLSTMRRLRSDGHGPTQDPSGSGVVPSGFPTGPLARELLAPTHNFSHVTVPDSVWQAVASGRPNTEWTILSQTQNPQHPRQPLYGLARQIVERGEIALSRLPHLRIGKLLATDRADMEALRTLRRLFNAYKPKSNLGKKPLSIGVFGAPGSGKSFGVKELALGTFAPPGAKEYAGWKEFNLSQFNGPEDLVGAFHQVRDIVLQGIIPVVFWDEFDSSNYKWLQYLLAPMQDGRFQEGQSTHTIGKCVFIFAGATSWTFDSFGVFEKQPDIDHFRLAKGPDFKSRLDGAYDVLGLNQCLVPPRDDHGNPNLTRPTRDWVPNPDDIYFPIRRALMVRSMLAGNPTAPLHFDGGLLTAILQNGSYLHGARSLEKVIEPLTRPTNFLDQRLRPIRSALPSPSQLRLHVKDPDEFHRLCREHHPAALLDPKTLETLAQAIHAYYSKKVRSRREFNPNAKAWAGLPPDTKHSNEAAARRMPDILALAGLQLVPGSASQKDRAEIMAHLHLHLELLAEAEHIGWMAERQQSGWTYNQTRDDKQRQHDCLKPYRDLPTHQQDKDRDAVLHYPDCAELIGCKIAFVKTTN